MANEKKKTIFEGWNARSKAYRYSVIVTVLGIIIAGWFIVRGLIWDDFVDPLGGVSLEKSSQFGDFIGGCVGTLFALTGVFLLFETLRLQRQELTESRYLFKLQQFDSLFFNSLNLYNDILSSIGDESGENKGRKFFENEMIKFISEPRLRSSGRTKVQYLHFYSMYEPQIAHYFRTLYQIFRQIEQSGIKEPDMLKYAKIIRAQLSLGELFFIYYNGKTVYGTKFREYINKYNLLKHLSIVDLPEFGGYFSNMSDIENHTCKVSFYEITKGIRYSLREKTEWYKVYLQGKLSIKVKPDNNECTRLSIDVIYSSNANPTGNLAQQGAGLVNFSQPQIKRLFSDYFVHIFNMANYNIKNGRAIIIRPEDTNEGGVTTMHYKVKRQDGKPIEL